MLWLVVIKSSMLYFCPLGTLDIHGEPNRDITLSLRETTAPVRIEPGTKNITLTRKLDKEGNEGPSSVTFTVLCDKRNHNEPVGNNLFMTFPWKTMQQKSDYIHMTILKPQINNNKYYRFCVSLLWMIVVLCAGGRTYRKTFWDVVRT